MKSDVLLEWKPQKGKKPTLKELESHFLMQIEEQMEDRDSIFLLGKEGSYYDHKFHDPIVDSVKPNKKVNIIEFLKYTDDYVGYYNKKKPVVVIIMDEDDKNYSVLKEESEIDSFVSYFKKNKMKRAWETACKFLETKK